MRFFKKHQTIINIFLSMLLAYFVVNAVTDDAWAHFLVYSFLIAVWGFVYRANAAAWLGMYQRAKGRDNHGVALLRWAIDKNTSSAAAYVHLAVYLLRKGSPDEAYALLERAELRSPGILLDKNIRLSKASCMWKMGQVGKGIEILEQMRKDYEYVNPHVLATLAYFYFLTDDDDKAVELSKAALEEEPALAAAWDNLGQICFRKGDMAGARENLLKAWEYKPNLADCLFYLGRVEEAEGNTDKAVEYYQQAVRCDISALNTITRAEVEEALDRLNTAEAV